MQKESSQQSTKPYRSLVRRPGHMQGVAGVMGSEEAAVPPGGILTPAEETPASPQLSSRLHEGKALVSWVGQCCLLWSEEVHVVLSSSLAAGRLAGNHG